MFMLVLPVMLSAGHRATVTGATVEPKLQACEFYSLPWVDARMAARPMRRWRRLGRTAATNTARRTEGRPASPKRRGHGCPSRERTRYTPGRSRKCRPQNFDPQIGL